MQWIIDLPSEESQTNVDLGTAEATASLGDMQYKILRSGYGVASHSILSILTLAQNFTFPFQTAYCYCRNANISKVVESAKRGVPLNLAQVGSDYYLYTSE